MWAPILLVALRLVQGFGAGAEYGGAVIMAVEHAPPGKRGLFGSFAPLGVTVGLLLANGVFALFAALPKEDFLSWGWRVPFLLSIVLILVGFYIRYRVSRDAGVQRDRGQERSGALAGDRGGASATRASSSW